ncbi:MAG: type II toxin-antitoxin system VapC family toxin [Acidobacteria bacterium]|nr:type II toxin-antitoxin system VapC family toxin [Acidobacteriota bacterium]
MKLLIDTHTFLWFILDSANLSDDALDLLESDADLLISIASLWEIAIKVSIGKLMLPQSYNKFIAQQLKVNSIDKLPIRLSHLTMVSTLPLHHRDPFDRMIIAQAIVENLPLVSADTAFDSYPIKRLW